MTKYTGSLFTDATRLMYCPHCGAAAGDQCKTPQGKPTSTPHQPRVAMLMREYPEALDAARRPISGSPGTKRTS